MSRHEEVPNEMVFATVDSNEVSTLNELRPSDFDSFIGQRDVSDHLKIMLRAARERGHVADHILLAGPPGLGKTSLAHIVSTEMQSQLRVTSGPVLTRPGDAAAILSDLSEGDVLFIDEIHRLQRSVEEMLYLAMEDRRVDVMVGRGPSARSIRIDLPPFTLVGATTRTGLLAGPLRDRVGFVARLDFYEVDELTAIVRQSAGRLGVAIDEEGAREVARRSRGTPRIANRLLRRVRDVAQVRGWDGLNEEGAREALTLFGVDEAGLDKVDRGILDLLTGPFAGQPVGLTTLSQAVGEEPQTLEDAYEPYLLRQGFIQRTPRGRLATAAAYRHVGRAVPNAGLF